MTEEHVHCHECGRPIETQLKVAGGKTKEREDIRAINVPVAVLTAQGPAFVLTPKPVCAGCAAEADAAAERAKAASKLIVPGLQGLPGGPAL